jgi:hypothetical protein
MLNFWSDRDNWWIAASTSTKFCRETYNKCIFQGNTQTDLEEPQKKSERISQKKKLWQDEEVLGEKI